MGGYFDGLKDGKLRSVVSLPFNLLVTHCLEAELSEKSFILSGENLTGLHKEEGAGGTQAKLASMQGPWRDPKHHHI